MTNLKIIKNSENLVKEIQKYKLKKNNIGFVPTLGALHKGHLELIRLAKKRSDVVVVSIFLNPVQFDSKKDFSTYPINISQDKKKIFSEKINILYMPTIKEIFPKKKIKIIKASKISKKLCGKYRKGHFDGVVTVLKELFGQVDPNIVYFGEKDFQQVMVVQDLINKYKLKIKVFVFPTVRDKSGLAYSSRNNLLNKKQKIIASHLLKTIRKVSKKIIKNPKDIKKIKNWGIKNLLKCGFNKVDYLEIFNQKTFIETKKIKNSRIFVSAWIGDIRLIDNYLIR